MPRFVRAVTGPPRAAGSENRRYVTYARGSGSRIAGQRSSPNMTPQTLKYAVLVLGLGVNQLIKSQQEKSPKPFESKKIESSQENLENVPKTPDKEATQVAIPTQAISKSTPTTMKASPLEQLKLSTPLERLLPRIEDVRSEAEKEPHQTPPSLIRFAAEMSEKMDIALQSKEAGQFLLNELLDCTSNEKTKTTASTAAACIKNAYELSSKYEDLSQDADRVKMRADPEAQRIYNSMKELGI